jgi:H/ACA ribonucleoprotein complex subunit 2
MAKDSETVEKREKKDKKEKKRKHSEVEAPPEIEVVSERKKEKKDKKRKSTDVDGDVVMEAGAGAEVTVVKEEDEDEKKPVVKVEVPLAALVPFANPLCDEKSQKKVLKSVKKGEYYHKNFMDSLN